MQIHLLPWSGGSVGWRVVPDTNGMRLDPTIDGRGMFLSLPPSPSHSPLHTVLLSPKALSISSSEDLKKETLFNPTFLNGQRL